MGLRALPLCTQRGSSVHVLVVDVKLPCQSSFCAAAGVIVQTGVFVQSLLGLAYAAGGDFDRALACIHRAKEAAPNDAQELLDKRIAGYKNKLVPPVVVGDL
jgi:hypothetical protein